MRRKWKSPSRSRNRSLVYWNGDGDDRGFGVWELPLQRYDRRLNGAHMTVVRAQHCLWAVPILRCLFYVRARADKPLEVALVFEPWPLLLEDPLEELSRLQPFVVRVLPTLGLPCLHVLFSPCDGDGVRVSPRHSRDLQYWHWCFRLDLGQ